MCCEADVVPRPEYTRTLYLAWFVHEMPRSVTQKCKDRGRLERGDSAFVGESEDYSVRGQVTHVAKPTGHQRQNADCPITVTESLRDGETVVQSPG